MRSKDATSVCGGLVLSGFRGETTESKRRRRKWQKILSAVWTSMSKKLRARVIIEARRTFSARRAARRNLIGILNNMLSDELARKS